MKNSFKTKQELIENQSIFNKKITKPDKSESENNHPEDTLREKDDNFRTFFDTVDDMIIVGSPDGKIIYANPAMMMKLGYSRAEFENMYVLDLHPAVKRKEAEAIFAAMIRGELDVCPLPLQSNSGVLVPVETRVWFGKWSGADCIVGISKDLTREQEALQKFNRLFQGSPTPMAVSTLPERFFSDVNNAFLNILGYSQAEVIGKTSEELGLFVQLEKQRAIAEKLKAEGRVTDIALQIKCKDGKILDGLFSGEIIESQGKKYFLTVMIDQTEQKRAERALKQANDDLEKRVGDRTEELMHVNQKLQIELTEHKRTEEEKAKLENQLLQTHKMEAIGTLAGGIAHDFNNILGSMIGYTEMAMLETDEKRRQKDLSEVLNACNRATDLVKQILAFSKKSDVDLKPINAGNIVKEIIGLIRSTIPSTIDIKYQISSAPMIILANSTQIHQVIMNLCSNAVHAMKRTGGILKIELSTIELGATDIPRHPDLQPGPYVKLAVSDTGHGIDPAHIQRIFDPFFTTKTKDEGTGLGLSVVYGIVKSHNGIINVYSEPDKGAVFNVYLPRIIHSESGIVNPEKPVKGGSERILFVDDEPTLVNLGTRILSSLGYEVTGVTSSVEALDIFLAEPQSFDLVITDMTLPKMTGIGLSRKILKIRADIPIILCSGIREADTDDQVKLLGIRAYLTKPLTWKELARVVRETLDDQKKSFS